MTPQKPKITLNSALHSVRHEFTMTGVFSFFINLLMLVSPLFMLQVYDRVLTSRNDFTLLMLTLLALVLLAVMGALEALRSRLLVRVGKKIDDATNDTLFDGVFTAAVFKRGILGGQYFRDMDSVRQFMTGAPVFAFFDAPSVPIYILIVFLMHPLLGLVALIGAIVILALAYANDRLTRGALRQASENSVRANDVVERSLRNAEALRAMGMTGGIRRIWRGHQDTALLSQCVASDRAGAVTAVSKAFRLMLQVLILAVGAYLAIRGHITAGMMIAASIIMGRGLAPLEQAIGSWRGFINARAAFRRLDSLLDALPDEQARMSLPPVRGAITVDRLIAAPPAATAPVIKGISFAIAAGEAVGIVGPSAAGKTTLARLILGLWPARSGSVRIDGADAFAWRRDELGPQIGYLPQDVELFAGSVAENIGRFGEISADKVVEASRRADVHDLILGLPNGYDTQIGIGGANLSAGQRQRIGLARALYGDPALLVLDEPNANLDTDGEAALAAAVRDLKTRNKTLIVISHRTAILELMDKIMVIKGGQLAAFAPRGEILPTLTGALRAPSQVEA